MARELQQLVHGQGASVRPAVLNDTRGGVLRLGDMRGAVERSPSGVANGGDSRGLQVARPIAATHQSGPASVIAHKFARKPFFPARAHTFVT